MAMRVIWLIAAGAMALTVSGCGNDSAPAAETTTEAKALSAGEYEVATKVEDLRSTDHTTPLTKAKQMAAGDAPMMHRACVAADGKIDADMFGEAGDKCSVQNSYVATGKINMQLSCTRSGAPGQVLQSVDGDYSADSFTATVNTGTYFSGSGDYAMRRTMTAKRVGACPAEGGKKA
jgi:hypothetical protein